MKINVSELVHWVSIGLVVLVVGSWSGRLIMDMKNNTDKMRADNIIRDANGGALPGVEVINENGHTYDVDRITFEGKKYICFSGGYRMGCIKDE